MNSDQLAALARAAITVAIGGVLLYGIGRYLGWWVAGAIVAAAVGDLVWCVYQLRWRLW